MSKKKRKNRPASLSFNPADSCSSLESIARRCAQQLRKYIKSNSLPHDLRKGFDVDEIRMNRRIQAVVNTVEDFLHLLETNEMEITENTAEFWIKLNMDLALGPDISENICFSDLAAAIWMLDYLAESGHFEDACHFFPPMDTVCDGQQNIPDVHDLCHEDDALRAMLWIIQHRNDDCLGRNTGNSSTPARVFMDDYTAEGKHRQDVPSRNRFEAILSLIPQDRIEDAVSSYMDHYHDIMLRMNRSHMVFNKEREPLYQKLDCLIESAHSMMVASQKMQLELSESLSPQADPFPGILDGENYKKMIQHRSMHDQNTAIERMMKKLDLTEGRCYNSIGLCRIMSDDQFDEFFGSCVRPVWHDFAVHNPYELCFAYLYLLDRGSDIPWVYGISSNLLAFCRNSLPWCGADEIGSEDVLTLHEDDTSVDLTTYSCHGTYVTDRFAGHEDIRKKYNLAQIIFIQTGYILPRSGYNYHDTVKWLERFGLENTEMFDPALNLISLFHIFSHRSHIPISAENQETEANADTEALQQRIRELESEQKRLREECYAAIREAKSYREQLEKFNASTANDRQELAELREIVFSLSNSKLEDDEADVTINFPCHTSKNIVAFGGHDTWYNEIRKKLPDVRFIKRGLLPNAQMLRNAEAIWLQCNAMSHPLYYSIRDLAQKHSVPIHYFKHASATKCARQLIMTHSDD